MLLTLRHETSYAYSEPIAYAIQSLRMTPRAYDGLSILSWRVRGTSKHELPSFTDGFGNLVHSHSVNELHRGYRITVEGKVETRDTQGLVQGAPEPLPPGFYLRPTPLTTSSAAIAELARAGTAAPGSVDWAVALMQEVRDRIDYKPGLTDARTRAEEALAKGVGVCQDHAHVFIAAARALAVPARYVSGYLWTGTNGGVEEASHAWAEAFLDGLGWVGFDPSNRIQPTESYIRLAVGLDYHSAAPVRGIRRGIGEESLSVSLRVTAAQEQ
jgi:transglutaminase-like putative cysteine protease